MQLITDTYRSLNEQLHKERPDYGTSGQKHAGTILSLAKALGTQDILDYGCGKSTLSKQMPFIIKQYDPAVPKYSAMPEPADIVVCTDVLEHIEPECLDKVLDHLADLTNKVGFFTIATRAAAKTLQDGRNAHLIVENGNWWLEKLMMFFVITNFQNMNGECIVVVSGGPDA
jgi:hypothetical protein